MKKNLSKIIGVILVVAGISCNGYYHFIVTPRPAPPVIVRPISPGTGFIWIEGEWFWDGRNYRWREGYWSNPRDGYRWEQGLWKKRGNGWYWAPGQWKKRR